MLQNPAALTGGDGSPAGLSDRGRTFTVGATIDVIGLGADPTGRKDSVSPLRNPPALRWIDLPACDDLTACLWSQWPALNAAIGKCLNQSALSPNGFFPGDDTVPKFGPIRDMGGCSVDLMGGEYRISKPLHVPEMNANMQFVRTIIINLRRCLSFRGQVGQIACRLWVHF